jgi:hypothetical protein
MTEETKQRLRERFEEILNSPEISLPPDKPYRTLADIERIALNIREEVAQATLEEMAKEEEQQAEEKTVSFRSLVTNISSIATKLPCPHWGVSVFLCK